MQAPQDPYAPQAALTDPARAAPQIWRLLLGMALVLFVMLSLGQMVFRAAHAMLSPDAYAAFLAGFDAGDTPAGLLAMLLLLGGLGIGTLCAARLLHQRSARSLFGARPLGQGLRVAVALVVLHGAILLLPPWDFPGPTDPGIAPGLWLTLLPLSIAALLIQTGAEELFFRGYLQSQLAARFRAPAVWLVLPSALFALGHHTPDLFGENAWLVTLWAFVFGVAMADLTARSGSLGPAMAVHFINNASAILFVSLQGQMSGLALSTLPVATTDIDAMRLLLVVDAAMIGLSWLTARLALRV
ncbi:CPBP family intramembrane glutamic endopeptidase [Thalassococcus sp. BH17M4-6]|uniref:CPBP family intramembrane glutamic endopeptidase n=1 Tax=Thalassococcus sp. BH17M4-6 TaxID=3413148 RepID=UPI003BC4AD7A